MTQGNGAPSADIWAYAARLDKALCQLFPEDFRMEFTDKELRVECTITTLIEAEAVCAAIRHLSKGMTSHRPMIREDILPPLVEPTFREKLAALFGDPAVGNADAPNEAQPLPDTSQDNTHEGNHEG